METLVEPGRLLTVREFLELEYDRERFKYELQEGNLVLKSSPNPDHGHAAAALLVQLHPQLPAEYEIFGEIDVDLQLAPPDGPGTVRIPDLFVVHKSARARVREDDTVLRARELLTAVEILSPSSRRTDRVIKFADYADAGIPHYWMVDLEPPISLRAYHLAGEFGYLESDEATGRYVADEPFQIELDLTALV